MTRPAILNITVDVNGTVQNIIATQKKFVTGSEGYYGFGKLIDPTSGEKYQVSMNFIRIGSKPVDDKKKK